MLKDVATSTIPTDKSEIYQYCRYKDTWTLIGGAGSEWVGVGGTVYGLTPDKQAVYKYNGQPESWSKVGGPAAELIGGGSSLYATQPVTGDLWKYTGVGENAYTVDYDGRRNGAVGPKYFQWDIRGGYDFELGRDNVFQFYVDVINVVNNSNFEPPTKSTGCSTCTTDQRRSNFMVLRSLVNNGLPRTIQIGLRFGF